MSIITLTTDFGLKDYFVGAIKGKILSEYNTATIVDISHNIDLFNVVESAYCIASSYSSFPKGTIHIIGVDTERILNREHLAMQWNNQFFICADNGILSILTQQKKPEKLVAITIHNSLNKPATDIDVFVTVACHIARGGLLNVIGNQITKIQELNFSQPTITPNETKITGSVIYIDNFGNCVTNISKPIFTQICRNRKFYIDHGNRKKITRLNNFFSDFNETTQTAIKKREGETIALFNDTGFLTIAIYKGNPKTNGAANTLLGLKYSSIVSVIFEE